MAEKTYIELWDLFKEMDKIEKGLRTEGNENKEVSELTEDDIDWLKVGYYAAKHGYRYSFEENTWYITNNKNEQ